MAASTQFQYTELDLATKHIRLVEILPACTGRENEVHCKIHVTSLEEQPEYVALSYTWGSATTNCYILLDGRRYPVRQKLFRFLHTMASKNTTGNLYWIDAISIDQANDKERTHQVKLMSQIYRSASRVCAWLGPAYEDSDRAMQAISLEASFWIAKGRILKIWRKPLGAAIRKLCDRPYWRRLWIFQELMLARETRILCGRWEICGSKFLDFLLQVRALDRPRPSSSEDSLPPLDDTIEQMAFADESAEHGVRSQRTLDFEHELMLNCSALKLVMQIGHAQVKPSLMQLMEATRHLRCSEPRDKAYALLGIAESGHEEITPDYTITLSTLLNDILRNLHQLNALADVQEVEQQCRNLADIFEVDTSSIFRLQGAHRSCEQLCKEKDPLFSLGIVGSGVNLWWAGMYEHKAVERSLFKCNALPWSTVLSRALEAKCAEVVQRLLDAGMSHFFSLDEALFSASLMGMMSTVSTILEEFVLSRAGTMQLVCERALRCACENGHETVVQLLLDAGADANAQYYDATWRYADGNALHLASKAGHENVVRTLISRGAQVDGTKHDYRETPFTFACMMGHTRVVQILLENGASVNMGHSEGPTALTAASRAGHEMTVQILLRSGADVNAMDGRGETALSAASWRGHDKIVRILLENRADVDGLDDCMGTAIISAAANGHHAVIRMLLENRADVNLQVDLYDNALAVATFGGHDEVVQILLEGGANVKTQGSRFGNALIAASLEPHNYQRIPVKRDKTQVTRMLLEHGADVHAGCSSYGSALVAASQGGREAIVQMLLAHGADINASSGEWGTAIEAAYTRHEALMQQASRLARSQTDWAAHVSTEVNRYRRIIRLLLANGAAFNARSEYAEVNHLDFDEDYVIDEEMLDANA